MDSNTETTKRVQTTSLGILDLGLSLDSSTNQHATSTQLRSSSARVAREVPLVVGPLLFSQRQIQTINDPSRLAAVAEMAETCRAARNGSLSAPSIMPNARQAATYHIEVLANGGFHVKVDEKVTGVGTDAAGGLTAGALPAELLTTLREPYRTFYREMIEAATEFWHERRPSLIESTWAWPLALRRLDQLMRGGIEGLGEPQVCANCHALRPAGFPCLHCESAPGEVSPPAVAEPLPPARPAEPVVESPAEMTTSVTVPPPPPLVAESIPEPPPPVPTPEVPPPPPTSPTSGRPAERTILAARELPPPVPVGETEEPPRRPLAGLLPRGIALVVDVVIGAILAGLAGYGLSMILLAAGFFGPNDDPIQTTVAITLICFVLYFISGWSGSETFGMLICRIQVVQASTQKRCGFFHAIGRGIGYLFVLAVGVIVFVVGNWIDNRLVFIPTGTPADDAIRAIVGLCSLYAMWLGSGQRIIGEAARQTWGDKIGKTLVVIHQKS